MVTKIGRRTLSALVVYIGLLICSSPAMAIPSLQLDIAGGNWINGTTYSQGDVFDLYALLRPKTVDGVPINLRKHEYTISASITPRQGEVVNADFGSIAFGTNTLDASTMIYGTPPNSDSDLPRHGIFPTYYWEHTFTFLDAPYAKMYDVQDVVGTHTGPQTWVDGDGPKLSYMKFNIDTSGLIDGYAVHFDFYHVDSDYVLIDKAPFSHDAESSTKVPEPSTLVLLGFGLMGVSLFGRKKS